MILETSQAGFHPQKEPMLALKCSADFLEVNGKIRMALLFLKGTYTGHFPRFPLSHSHFTFPTSFINLLILTKHPFGLSPKLESQNTHKTLPLCLTRLQHIPQRHLILSPHLHHRSISTIQWPTFHLTIATCLIVLCRQIILTRSNSKCPYRTDNQHEKYLPGEDGLSLSSAARCHPLNDTGHVITLSAYRPRPF